MQTQLSETLLSTEQGREADALLRRCVHCGFCNATCPTYQLQGDELDGPRGRIYLIKQLLEGEAAVDTARQHLDRCLTCRNCETTCPSGVEYSRLLDIGREHVEQRGSRPFFDTQRHSAAAAGHFRLAGSEACATGYFAGWLCAIRGCAGNQSCHSASLG